MLRCFWNVSTVLLVLFIFFYMFAISGMQLFADTKYGLELTANSNFNSFGESMLTLLKVSAGAAPSPLAAHHFPHPLPCNLTVLLCSGSLLFLRFSCCPVLVFSCFQLLLLTTLSFC